MRSLPEKNSGLKLLCIMALAGLLGVVLLFALAHRHETPPGTAGIKNNQKPGAPQGELIIAGNSPDRGKPIETTADDAPGSSSRSSQKLIARPCRKLPV